jgi:hypothetical protein
MRRRLEAQERASGAAHVAFGALLVVRRRRAGTTARVLEDQITIRSGEPVPRDCSGEANAGCFRLATGARPRMKASENESGATKAKDLEKT